MHAGGPGGARGEEPLTLPRRSLAKKIVGGIYSYAAGKLYEPVVVQTAFPLFGGNLNALVEQQGQRAVTAARGGPILDMPVGTAYFTSAIARRHPGFVVGSDIAKGMVREARRTAEDAALANLVVVQADAHHLPFRDNTFPAAMCTNGLQVMPGLERAVAELARVVAPGGTLFVSVITAPVAAVLPVEVADRLPTLLRSRRDIERTLVRFGLNVVARHRQRLAFLLDAVKSAP